MPTQLLPPAQPYYVLRGHGSQIHAVKFSSGNRLLLTGDAEGWVICWGIVYKRPLAVWRAHENAVLALAWWNEETVISHGRDSKLVVWDLSSLEHADFDKTLPIDAGDKQLKKPAIVHELALNTLNFCAFAHCLDPKPPKLDGAAATTRSPLLLAVPHTLDSEAIDIFQLPSTSRLATIPAPSSPAMGMAMALAVCTTSDRILIVAGYESGHAIVWCFPLSKAIQASNPTKPPLYKDGWTQIYQSQAHKQPILSLAIAIDKSHFITTSADAVVAKHPLIGLLASGADTVQIPTKTVQTKHSGQQGVSMRNDGKIFATAGWDAKVRLYSGKSMREVAVLKWHKDGCYATSFSKVSTNSTAGPERGTSIAASEAPANEIIAAGQHSTDGAAIGYSEGKDVALRGGTALLDARRTAKAVNTHWLAVGAKDGRVSLWDVF